MDEQANLSVRKQVARARRYKTGKVIEQQLAASEFVRLLVPRFLVPRFCVRLGRRSALLAQ